MNHFDLRLPDQMNLGINLPLPAGEGGVRGMLNPSIKSFHSIFLPLGGILFFSVVAWVFILTNLSLDSIIFPSFGGRQ